MPQHPLWQRAATGALLIALVLGSACSRPSDASPLAAPTTTTAAPTTTTTTLPPTTTTTATTLPPNVTAEGRTIMHTGYRPFASAQGVVINYPTEVVERVGFHESNRLGARLYDVLATAGDWLDMPSRDRKTPSRGAADILSDPNLEVRAPVTGRVLRGGTYTLYCKYTDSFLVIEPDAHPGWEVKVLHINGLVALPAGTRVDAGVTRIAAHPTRLPFASQVEDFSAHPVWPHVHVEVVDPNIKNPPGVGGNGCS
ncbi:MAG: hypothetical protein QOF21_1907 [Actinomycetota bacterium]|jgi:hypothetical protein